MNGEEGTWDDLGLISQVLGRNRPAQDWGLVGDALPLLILARFRADTTVLSAAAGVTLGPDHVTGHVAEHVMRSRDYWGISS